MHTAIVAKENARSSSISNWSFGVFFGCCWRRQLTPQNFKYTEEKKIRQKKNQVLHITHNIHTQRTKSNQLNNCKRYNKPIMYQDNKNITKSTVKEKKNKKERKKKYIYPTPPLTHRHHHYLPTYWVYVFLFFFLHSGNGKFIIGRITPPPP